MCIQVLAFGSVLGFGDKFGDKFGDRLLWKISRIRIEDEKKGVVAAEIAVYSNYLYVSENILFKILGINRIILYFCHAF